jgi:hypothetical protein
MTTRSELQQLKKCVTFIFTPNDERLVPRGTGFFVGLPLEKRELLGDRVPGESAAVHVSLVTAKHVLKDKNGELLDHVLVRLNTKDGGSEIVPVVLSKDLVFTHEEEQVDLAVIPLNMNPTRFDAIAIQDGLISTKETIEKFEIGEGDDILFLGLFTHHYGKARNQPIVRFGKVALMPEEKVEVDNRLEDLYLMECQSIAANSGAPVFFEISLMRRPQFLPQRLFLAGVMKGHFHPDIFAQDSNLLGERPYIGISAVTPAYKLHEILHAERMRAFRTMIEENTFKALHRES